MADLKEMVLFNKLIGNQQQPQNNNMMILAVIVLVMLYFHHHPSQKNEVIQPPQIHYITQKEGFSPMKKIYNQELLL